MDPKRLRRLALSSLATASAVALAGCGDGDRDPKRLARPAAGLQTDADLDVPEPIIPAEEITRAFAQDKASADRKYGVGAEDITIRGAVAEVVRVGGMSITHVMLKGHDPGDGQEPRRIQCTLRTANKTFKMNAVSGPTDLAKQVLL